MAVKSAKRLLRNNVGPNGSIRNDKFLRAMLQLRNTPDPDCSLSPAEIVFGRRLKDAFSFTNRLNAFKDKSVRPSWRDAWNEKELALRKRLTRWHESANRHCKALPALKVGNKCFIQNQHGPHERRWDRSGTVVEALPFDQYLIKVDGSGRVTRRNRRFLKRFEPATTEIAPPIPTEAMEPVFLDVHQPGAPSLPVEVPQPVDRAAEVQQSPKVTEKKPPLMLRRLASHNKPGLKEDPLPETAGRLRTR